MAQARACAERVIVLPRHIPAGVSTVGEALAQARRMQNVTPITGQAILAHVLGQGRARLLARPEAPLPRGQSTEFAALLERAAQGEPLAYLTGEREFCGLVFTVTPDVLIPRPETEMLVDVAVQWAEQRHKAAPHIADVGTGSGAIAVTVAARLPQVCITAVDVSPAALDVARHNASRHGVGKRTVFMQGSLLEDTPGPFDAILANLPYIPTETLQTLDVSRWEPSLALDGGPDGLDLIRVLVRQAVTRLLPGGLLALEIQYDQGPPVSSLCRDAFPDAITAIKRDLAGLDRVVCVEVPADRA
ncbi:MAG: peptide chain release factor N(5)-glutamine methyltransferase [Anaerolineae bacterium]|nr:peptide chain release factor N(5)-glutamine methyltransferase [Anaerolineae bacterium]